MKILKVHVPSVHLLHPMWNRCSLYIRQCRFLESSFEMNYTSTVLLAPDQISTSRLKKNIIDRNWLSLLSAAASNAMFKLSQQIKKEAGQRFGTLPSTEVLCAPHVL